MFTNPRDWIEMESIHLMIFMWPHRGFLKLVPYNIDFGKIDEKKWNYRSGSFETYYSPVKVIPLASMIDFCMFYTPVDRSTPTELGDTPI